MFVSRVLTIYTACMVSELAKGTSISHQTSGMDPQRLLLTGDQEDAAMRAELTVHVCRRLYYISVQEWALTAEVCACDAHARVSLLV